MHTILFSEKKKEEEEEAKSYDTHKKCSHREHLTVQ